MKSYLSLYLLTLFLTTSMSHADDYVWGEEFKEGDIISAATFNQIFNTLQKLNRTPVDADLVGTWSCSAIEKMSNNAQKVNGWSQQGFLWVLPAQQVTMSASGDNSSMLSPYSISTGAPSPFYINDNASMGTYSLFNGMLFLNGISGAVDQYYVDIVSDDRFVLQGVTSGGTAVPDFIICDSAIAVPAAPTATIATNAQTLVNVTWTDQSSDETGFKIYRRLSNATEVSELATAITASPYVDSTLTEGQTAYYSVSAYNANGESAKSKTVSATLDSVKPTVSSHSPTTNQAVANTSRSLSITFSEAVKIICPAGGNGPSCTTAGFAITAVGTKGNDELSNYNYEFPVSGSPFASAITVGQSGIVFSGDLTPMNIPRGDTITVTIHKEWIQDANGNPMDADYTYTFTTGS